MNSSLISKKFVLFFGTPVVGYSFFLSLTLGLLTPLQADASAFCKVLSKSQAVFDGQGKVVSSVPGSQEVKIEQKTSKNGGWFIPKYKINLSKNKFYTVYKLDGTTKYIDISSCASTSQTDVPELH
jgi:hypothetical protein